MENYTIENEKISSIKRFFIKNSKILIILLIIGASIIVTWNYWQSYQENNFKKSAKSFEKISSQLEQISSKQTLMAAEQFANETNNIYGVLVSIKLAKILVEKNDIIYAENILLRALAVTKSDNLKDLINIRLARLQLALNKIDQVLISLSQINNQGLDMIIEDIRGDLLLKKGDINGARLAYSNGIKSSGDKMMKTILKLKINSLPN
ncbi:MAG: YfgM family protein [Arsenophonus sp. ET-DL9-MAG3]